jgi:hypothetical protein
MTHMSKQAYRPGRNQEILPGQVWTGRRALLGRVIRVTSLEDDKVHFEVIEGSRTSKPIRRASLLAQYGIRSDPRVNPVADNGEELTLAEGQVIASFYRLADRWPGTLKVVVVNSELRILHTSRPVHDSSVLARIRGVPGE